VALGGERHAQTCHVRSLLGGVWVGLTSWGRSMPCDEGDLHPVGLLAASCSYRRADALVQEASKKGTPNNVTR